VGGPAAKNEKQNYGVAARRRERGVGDLVMTALWRWGRSSPRRMVFLLRVAWRLWRAKRRRLRHEHHIDRSLPAVVAISPTMRCNYNCAGCYSRGGPTDNELSTNELDTLLTEAEGLGILAIVVTGGEPLLRDDMLELMARHRRLLFVPITNGSLVTPETARHIARSGNVVLLVSIEGFPADTDERRQSGAHETAIHALELLRDARACFGFAATNTAANTDHLGSDAFIDRMVALGCSVGYFIEYVPCGPNARLEWILDEAARAVFRQRVLDLRRRKPLVLIQFPHDEYTARTIAARRRDRGRSTLTRKATSSPVPSWRSLARTSVKAA
jgi:MoaA/NifB/PqqE/SkfB family radical SAM enzyme